MWIYFFSGENCKYCIEPKRQLEDFKCDKAVVSFKDISDDLFKQFGLSKVPALVIVETNGDIRKYQGAKKVSEEINRLKITTKLNLTVEF